METACCSLYQLVAGSRLAIEEPSCHRSPYQRYDTLGNHGSVEDGTTHLLALQAARHQWALCSVETGDGTTGNGDKQGGEDVVFPRVGLCCSPHVIEVRPQLGHRRPVQEEPYHQCCRHEQQREGEERIDFADNLVDGQHRRYDIVAEDDDGPHHGIAAHRVQNLGRAVDKHRSHHDQQKHGEHQHHRFRALT